jgi:6-phosphogluconate dehydrogenase
MPWQCALPIHFTNSIILHPMKPLSDIGLVGLAVMGENLILNMASKGFTVTAYNRTADKVQNFLDGRAQGKTIRGAFSITELVDSLAKPRKIMLK